MKSFFMVLLFGVLIALAGSFCEMWKLPYVSQLPTYRTLQLKERVQALVAEEPKKSERIYKRPFANAPNEDSVRRTNALQNATRQLDSR